MWGFLKGAGFITPGIVRTFISDKSGLGVGSLYVRVWAAAIFYAGCGFVGGLFVGGAL